jgi:uncharacterized membrane protein SpoIIM required for sporulation
MSESTIITGQFVRISQTPASIGERMLALIIDYILLFVYVVGFSIALSYLKIHAYSGFSFFFLFVIVYLPVFCYSLLCEVFNRGQSLGNGYVDMTLENIANGEPMAVYNGSEELPMFLGITLNNIMVSFNCFAMGLLTSFGTGYMLLSNGIMLGAFQTFFYGEGLLTESMLAIWLHGTLEIWAIIVAGAAGLALGNGWLFPGTYSRAASFRRGAKRGLKIVVGTVPVFIMAGFIEGFLTRHTEFPTVLRLGIILLSLAFIIFYYINLPNRKRHGVTES